MIVLKGVINNAQNTLTLARKSWNKKLLPNPMGWTAKISPPFMSGFKSFCSYLRTPKNPSCFVFTVLWKGAAYFNQRVDFFRHFISQSGTRITSSVPGQMEVSKNVKGLIAGGFLNPSTRHLPLQLLVGLRSRFPCDHIQVNLSEKKHHLIFAKPPFMQASYITTLFRD